MIKNIFFDRDGIVNETILRDGGAFSPLQLNEFKVKREFVDFFRSIEKKKLNLFIVSNQPDIARGKLSESTLRSMTAVLESMFTFKEILYCRHDDQDDCNCRKPKPGMIETLISKYCLKREECLIVGDSWKDVAAGKSAGIKTVFLVTSYNEKTVTDFDFEVESLEDMNTKQILGG
ncbi:MAG TPA: HAD-IIIA family hydrolase [Candidatus Acidoferrales bacterium]|nr:HAD-IIIA family hydrolase [Candidatus Acidoferrales bacterium]